MGSSKAKAARDVWSRAAPNLLHNLNSTDCSQGTSEKGA